jgi:hypothetical protein
MLSLDSPVWANLQHTAMCKSGAFGCALTRHPENLGGDGASGRVPPVAGKEPLGGLACWDWMPGLTTTL